MKVLIINDISSLSSKLQKGLQSLGYKCNVINPFKSKYINDNYNNSFFANFFSKSKRFNGVMKRKFCFIRILWKYQIQKYDFIVFNYGAEYIFSHIRNLNAEEKVNFFRKIFGNAKLIFYYQGSDGRHPIWDANFNNPYKDAKTKEELFELKKFIEEKVLMIETVEKIAHSICGGFDGNFFLNRNYINYYFVGNAFYDYLGITVDIKKHQTEYVKIIHSPSNRMVKGSDLILEVINDLKHEGLKIEYKELHNVSQKQVLEIMAQSHILIDQVYSDSLANSALLEGAYYKCLPVIMGYSLNKIYNTIPEEVRPPFIHLNFAKENLKNEIRKLVLDQEYRIKKAELASDFVKRHFTCENLAKNFIKFINGEVPTQFIITPDTEITTTGSGLTIESIFDVLQNYINVFGYDALHINNHYVEQKIKHLTNPTDLL